jgi:hypothetical protein
VGSILANRYTYAENQRCGIPAIVSAFIVSPFHFQAEVSAGTSTVFLIGDLLVNAKAQCEYRDINQTTLVSPIIKEFPLIVTENPRILGEINR